MPLVVSALIAVVTFVLALVPPMHFPGAAKPPDEPLYPAPPGYLLPWAGGEIHAVTQGEETSFTHNGLAAYAFDFNLNYDTVVASRSGRIVLTYDGSNSGGCSSTYSGSTNYVTIDHGDGTSAAYMHLAYDSVVVSPGDLVERGQALAISGETGVTCSGNEDDAGPGAHLHFQVQRYEEGRYFTQSVPVAFDDIPDNDGVPVEGRSYVSGNYGKGKPQKIALTPYRVPRVFDPKAVPLDPRLREGDPAPVAPQTPPPPPPGAPPPPPDAQPTTPPDASPSPPPPPPPADTATATPSPTPTPTPTVTPTAPAAGQGTAQPNASTTTATSTPTPTGTAAPSASGSEPPE